MLIKTLSETSIPGYPLFEGGLQYIVGTELGNTLINRGLAVEIQIETPVEKALEKPKKAKEIDTTNKIITT